MAVAVAGILLLAVMVVVVAPVVRQPADREAGDPALAAPSSSAKAHSEILAAATGALSAWGRFAGTGDLTGLAGHFHEDGPQYRQLVEEAPGIEADGVKAGEYQVVSESRVEELSADRAQVRATVVWQRPGEPDQRKAWLIEMRSRPGGGWEVWTVRSAAE